jgi:PEP-CTERM motif
MTTIRVRYAALCIALICFACVRASADSVSTTGAMTLIAAPGSIVQGSLESNTAQFVFQEQSGLTLGSNLAVDVTTAGTFNSLASLTAGFIASGTVVNSYLIHAEAVNVGAASYMGSVTFNSAILGIIVLSKSLDNTDALLGHPGTLYPVAGSELSRGLELGSALPFDSVIVSGQTVTFTDAVNGAQDEIRVITAAPVSTVPEPGSVLLLGTGLLGLVGAARRKFLR